MTDSTVIQPQPGTVLLATDGHGRHGHDGFGGSAAWSAATMREVEAFGRLNSNDFKDVTRDLGTTRFQLAEIFSAQSAAAAKTASELQLQLAKCCCEIQSQIAKCCCEIEKQIREDGDATRQLINSNTIQNLRDANHKQDVVLAAYFAKGVPPVVP